MATSTPKGAFRLAVEVLAALLLSGCAGYGTSAIGTPVAPPSNLTPALIARRPPAFAVRALLKGIPA